MIKNLLLFFMIFLFVGCSVFPKKGTWGKNAFYPVRSERIKNAFLKNISSPHIWVPVTIGSVLYTTGYDEKLAAWAIDESNVYKNRRYADIWSDNFNSILLFEMYASVLATPSLDNDGSVKSFLVNKAKGGIVINTASSASRFSTDQIRKFVHRPRPNKLDDRSLPSGHAAEAGSRRNLISKTLDAAEMNEHLRTGINGINTTMAIGTLWARVEGKRHYPSDVLFGYAFGSFISGFIYDSLINYDPNHSVVFMPVGELRSLSYVVNF